jgi:hypothetical protein
MRSGQSKELFIINLKVLGNYLAQPSQDFYNDCNPDFDSIETLKTFPKNWRIKAKVVKKYKSNEWSKENSHGIYFNCLISDSNNSLAKCTFLMAKLLNTMNFFC